MPIDIIPTGAAVGAEIRGVDLAQPLDDAGFAAIEQAYNEHGVIFFRDQKISFDDQIRLGRYFGPLGSHQTSRHMFAFEPGKRRRPVENEGKLGLRNAALPRHARGRAKNP